MNTIKAFKIACTMLAAFASAGVAHAQNSKAAAPTASSGSIAATLPEDQAKDKSPFSMLFETEYSNNMYKENDPSRDVSLGFAFAPSYVFSDRVSAFSLITVTKEESGQKNTILNNTQIGVNLKGFQLGEKTSTVHSLTGVAPTNSELRKTDRYQGGLRVGNGISTEIFGASLKYTFFVLRNFHEFTLNAEGKANIQYSLQHRVDLAIPIIGKLELGLTGIHRTGYTYRDFNRFAYIFEPTLSYEVLKNFSIFGGTSTDAPALKANGTESNMTVFDENRSVVRSGFNYVF